PSPRATRAGQGAGGHGADLGSQRRGARLKLILSSIQRAEIEAAIATTAPKKSAKAVHSATIAATLRASSAALRICACVSVTRIMAADVEMPASCETTP